MADLLEKDLDAILFVEDVSPDLRNLVHKYAVKYMKLYAKNAGHDAREESVCAVCGVSFRGYFKGDSKCKVCRDEELHLLRQRSLAGQALELGHTYDDEYDMPFAEKLDGIESALMRYDVDNKNLRQCPVCGSLYERGFGGMCDECYAKYQALYKELDEVNEKPKTAFGGFLYNSDYRDYLRISQEIDEFNKPMMVYCDEYTRKEKDNA
jgi:hypothetical protein